MKEKEIIKLPPIKYKSAISVEEAIFNRRSVRRYRDFPVTLEQVSQLLWSAQGITSECGFKFRAVPSAGATYPLEVYLVAGKVIGLDPGLYHYLPDSHSIALIKSGDLRDALARAAFSQEYIAQAPMDIVICAVYERTTSRYGTPRGIRYVDMEAGHTGQNISLQAITLGLDTVMIGAFNDDAVAKVLELTGSEKIPIYIIPVGKKL